jgi:hypothetical protein
MQRPQLFKPPFSRVWWPLVPCCRETIECLSKWIVQVLNPYELVGTFGQVGYCKSMTMSQPLQSLHKWDITHMLTKITKYCSLRIHLYCLHISTLSTSLLSLHVSTLCTSLLSHLSTLSTSLLSPHLYSLDISSHSSPPYCLWSLLSSLLSSLHKFTVRITGFRLLSFLWYYVHIQYAIKRKCVCTVKRQTHA